MNELIIAQDIVPIGEFRRQTALMIRRVRDEGQSLVITQNGRPAGVLIPPEEYDRMQQLRRQYLDGVVEGLRQSEAGDVLSSEDVDSELDSAFGPLDE